MAFMEWDDSFSVNVAEIDDQHKKLIGMVNTFNDSIIDDKKAAFGDLLSSLVDYAAYHFSTEEKYMDKFNYPGTEAHKSEHELFAAKALDVKKRFEDGTLVISLEVTEFLKNWIANHVLGTDKKYSQCFNDNGLR
jgi:hemerythrin